MPLAYVAWVAASKTLSFLSTAISSQGVYVRTVVPVKEFAQLLLLPVGLHVLLINGTGACLLYACG